MKRKAYAKVNLALNVTNNHKPNGLHNLDMINVSISLCDVLKVKFIEDHQNNIVIDSNANIPKDNSNLVYQVIEKYKRIYKKDFSINVFIKKNIPMQAGLAGGSSDASCMLNILDKHYKSNMSVVSKMAFIEELTSDGPYCILSTLSRVQGFGNKVYPIKANIKKKTLIIKPIEGCNTKDVFSSLDYKTMIHPNINKLETALKENNFQLLAKHIGNSLVETASNINKTISPTIAKLKEIGFEIVCMSGSGSTIFAISDNKKLYKKALNLLNKNEYELVSVYKLLS